MNERLQQQADAILDNFAEQPGTMSVIEIDAGKNTLTKDEARQFVEVVKTSAMTRGITVNAWIQNDPGAPTIIVQHLVEE